MPVTYIVKLECVACNIISVDILSPPKTNIPVILYSTIPCDNFYLIFQNIASVIYIRLKTITKLYPKSK